MLFPEPSDEVAVDRAYAEVDRQAPAGRPWVLVNMVATADGGTAIDGRSGPLGGPPDRKVFPNIRAVADVVLAAAGTVRAESYGPPRTPEHLRAQRAARGQTEVPRLAIVTSSLDLDPRWELFTAAEIPPLVVTTVDAPAERRAALEPVAQLVTAGEGRVDLPDALAQIADAGARIVVGEGGPSLNGQLLAGDMVDELCLTVAPLAIGGASARIAHGPDLPPRGLALAHVLEEDGVLFLRYVRR
jgi:riboflavin biosynthesis pyrimidine reductase